MRKVLIIAGNSLLRTARDKQALALLLLMPMILIGILGSALKGMMGKGEINPFKVVVVSQDSPARPVPQAPEMHLGKLFLDDVLGSDQAKRIITTVVETDLAKAKEEVTAGRAVALVQIPAGYTADTLSAKKTTVQVYSDPGHPLQAKIVMQIVGSFTEGVTAGVLSGKLIGADLVQGALPKVTEIAPGTRSVSAMQYYAAAMAVMFMVMTAFGRAGDIISERQNGTLGRILVSPTGKATVLAGQALGTVTVLLAQFLVLMAGTSLIFGVYWGPVLPALALGGAFALATAGIGLATASVLNDPKATDAAIGLVGMLFAALSGAMFPLYGFPDVMKMIAKVIPNYWALTGFLDQMSGLGTGTLWLPVAILTAIGVGTGLAGTLRLATR